ncbi:hypothetical protein AMELA_G00009100 [Ameiurus melas]|uniref:Uncharacterized protein n=1 Tax=Ameiurus melas TaxID=219545 RepID=A0A7J6BG12_AMEME|nr:hypothetical protein AMELA_G00009100 [Ameiurus melas]
MILDDRLTFTDHISATAKLYNIKKIQPYITEQATQILVQALISKLEYCNSLAFRPPSELHQTPSGDSECCSAPRLHPVQDNPRHTPLHLPPLVSCSCPQLP